ncbi:CDP-alcohol phosphatidyltransferase family protein [Acinetobacter baumannii]|nr:CDP-alcohol phosphatidyltransferase family protein [Acinetobacter baumannii]
MRNELQENRRPLKVRKQDWVKNITKWLSNRSVTPNQISILSIAFASLSALCFVLAPLYIAMHQVLLYIFAALFIQGRLLCNLFDGLVAIEGGKSTASGELFNDIPDRISDPIIIIAAGYSIVCVDYGNILGWCGALLAIFTAYVRTLAVSIHAPANFMGPMAKQHRMALLTLAAVLTAIEQYFFQHDYVLVIAIIILNIGCLLTIFYRVRAAYCYLEK